MKLAFADKLYTFKCFLRLIHLVTFRILYTIGLYRDFTSFLTTTKIVDVCKKDPRERVANEYGVIEPRNPSRKNVIYDDE